MSKVLIFGATGSVGKHIYDSFQKLTPHVIGTSTQINKHLYVNQDHLDNLNSIDPVDVVVWCQGFNINDNILDFQEDEYIKVMNANVLYIIKTLNFLLKNNKLINNAKLVIISSIWEEFTRGNKLSYSISKSALQGLVKNVSYDLSKKNILINNVLPGVIDNEMTRKTLTDAQIDYVRHYLFFERLVNLNDVFNAVKFLTIDNTGITGESIKVDLGFSHIKKYN